MSHGTIFAGRHGEYIRAGDCIEMAYTVQACTEVSATVAVFGNLWPRLICVGRHRGSAILDFSNVRPLKRRVEAWAHREQVRSILRRAAVCSSAVRYTRSMPLVYLG